MKLTNLSQSPHLGDRLNCEEAAYYAARKMQDSWIGNEKLEDETAQFIRINYVTRNPFQIIYQWPECED